MDNQGNNMGDQSKDKDKKESNTFDYVLKGITAVGTTISMMLPIALMVYFFSGNTSQNKHINFSEYIPKQMMNMKREKKVALLPIYGTISEVDNQSSVSSETITSFIDSAERKNVDGYIFEINSGGGYVLPSKDIMNRIKEIKKPKIALIRNVGASGAYWIASATDKIIADELSLVGSIGVRAEYLHIEGLMEKLGIKNEEIKMGKNKTMGTIYRAPTDEERKLFDNLIREDYIAFVKSVADNRRLSFDYVKELATGEIFHGNSALEKKLIDGIGNRKVAGETMYHMLGDKAFSLLIYTQSVGFLDGIFSEFGYNVGKGITDALTEKNLQQRLR